jgi:hypothetical protein
VEVEVAFRERAEFPRREMVHAEHRRARLRAGGVSGGPETLRSRVSRHGEIRASYLQQIVEGALGPKGSAFFPVLVNVSLALRSAPKAAIDLCHAYGGDARTTLRQVQIPTALPALFASLRIAAPLALIGALLAEWLSTGKGLGYLMLQSESLSNYNMLWSATALVTIYSIVVYSIIAAIEKVALAKYGDVRA